jgi:hypothetical protein
MATMESTVIPEPTEATGRLERIFLLTAQTREHLLGPRLAETVAMGETGLMLMTMVQRWVATQAMAGSGEMPNRLPVALSIQERTTSF